MLVNQVTYATGMVNDAFSFDGASEVVVANNANLNPGTITIDAWVLPTQFDGRLDIIVNKGPIQVRCNMKSEFEAPKIPNIGSLSRGDFAFYLRGVQGLPDEFLGWVGGGASIPVNVWTHVALTYNGSTARTFVNGVINSGIVGIKRSDNSHYGIAQDRLKIRYSYQRISK